ncbi:MAG TPA: hypothetical protein ENN19_06955 [Chloroflexi bacterium]|nr:hypothetical protein [Chloroflexota bacterium]
MKDAEFSDYDDYDYVTIHVVYGLLRAQVFKAKFEAANIPVLLEYESLGPIFGITADGIGEVRIKVPPEFADEARELIE